MVCVDHTRPDDSRWRLRRRVAVYSLYSYNNYKNLFYFFLMILNKIHDFRRVNLRFVKWKSFLQKIQLNCQNVIIQFVEIVSTSIIETKYNVLCVELKQKTVIWNTMMTCVTNLKYFQFFVKSAFCCFRRSNEL